ncbi:MAG: glycosyltransferase [Candidatus Latescibacteria bacterium]|nr:glycosyltransferase [bacterium]MBD3424065.1 glycosyltransferase [Candidatus Latescibacterota bacterium]
MFIQIIFFILILLVLYAYFGYPLILALFSAAGRRKRYTGDETGETLPELTLLIAAYNEEDIIEEKILNSLELDYPADRLNLAVVSDGSTDGTDEITMKYADRGVQLIRVKGRRGKTVARNEAVERTGSEVIVFSDANAIYRKDALIKLARHFSDPEVGAVCGNLRLVEEGEDENLYWKYEKLIKRYEDRFHSIIGANGSIYAIRRDLYRPLPPEVDDDFIAPLMAYSEGYRLVLDLEAVSIERDISSSDMHVEFQAKRRVVLRGIQSLARVSHLLNPLRHPAISFELISHKILRWSIPFLLLAILLLNFFMPRSALYSIIFFLQIIFYSAAVTGILSGFGPFYVPAYFVSTNTAVFLAVVQYLMGRRSRTWEKKRG